MKAPHPHLRLVQLVPPPQPVVIRERSGPWWEAPEFLALTEVRRAMVGGAVPAAPAQTAEQSARNAVFWALFEVEHVIAQYAKLLQAGEDVRIRTSVYTHEERRVQLGLRIVEHVEITGGPQ